MSVDAFNARALFRLRPDRLYRVYARRGELIFVRIGGQANDWTALLGALLGPIGGMIAERLGKRSRERLRRRIEEVDRLPPEMRVREHRHGFQLSVGQIAAARLLQPARVASHGAHVARWTLDLHSGERWQFQLEEPEDVSLAVPLLQRELGDRLELLLEGGAPA